MLGIEINNLNRKKNSPKPEDQPQQTNNNSYKVSLFLKNNPLAFTVKEQIVSFHQTRIISLLLKISTNPLTCKSYYFITRFII